MRSAGRISLIVFVAALSSSAALCADIMVSGGNIELVIASATAGSNPVAAQDETCGLTWTTLPADPTKKIAVQSDLGSPNFTLQLIAIGISAGDGSGNGTVPVGATAQDVIVSIPADTPGGTCTLRYTASATAGDGTGSDLHIVTFTITDQ